MQDLRGNTSPMGGVTLLLSGDFRQTLPVIQGGTRADQVKACLKKSSLWPQIKSLRLTINMRLRQGADPAVAIFASTLLQIGDGIIADSDQKVHF